jgi:transcriptional regulator with XRE-family HTH domain
MSFKNRLRSTVKYRGLLMKQVARCAGIKESTFLSYVDAREHIPPADVAVRIADVLDVSVEYLVNGTDTETTEAEIFYRKYKQYQDILQELDKLPHTIFKPVKTSILMMLYGYLNS